MRHYFVMWKRIFDYKGRSTREEYRVPLIVTAVLAALTAVFWGVGTLTRGELPMTVGFMTGVLYTAHVLPMMALTVRRLRDAGRKPGLAALSCLAGIGTILVMIICLFSVSVSGFLPIGNVNACVYGPPPEYYDPQNNINEDIYGPPEMLESRYAEEASEIASRRAAEGEIREEVTSDEN